MSTAYATGMAGLVAGGTIAKYDLVELSTYPSVTACGADTDKPLGIAQHAAVSGEPVAVWPLDGSIRIVRSSAAISAGAEITCTTAGEVKTAAAGDYIVGHLLVAATDADQELPALVAHIGASVKA